MVGPVSRVSNLVSASLVKFERTAAEVVRAAAQLSENEPAAEASDMVGPTSNMISARFAFSAALVAAHTSNEMLAEAIDLGGYAHAR